jgi:hypothetical protein
MDEEGVLAGTNWDANLCGLELNPRALMQELLIDKEAPSKNLPGSSIFWWSLPASWS